MKIKYKMRAEVREDGKTYINSEILLVDAAEYSVLLRRKYRDADYIYVEVLQIIEEDDEPDCDVMGFEDGYNWSGSNNIDWSDT